jgi:excisionase family DNA binding protein
MRKDVPIWEKYSLSVEEAAAYYGIGIKKLYEIIRSNPNADFLLEVGTHYRIKRALFEAFLDEANTI